MATDCNGCGALFEGIPKECSNNIGGIKKIYLTEKCNVTAVTVSSPADIITGLTMTGSTVFYEFAFNKNSSTFTEVTENSAENGTELTTQTITLKMPRREKSKRDTIALLGMQKDLVAIVTDSNDISWYFGEVNGLNMTTSNSETGLSKKDFNGYTITLVGEEPEQANEINAAAVAAAIA